MLVAANKQLYTTLPKRQKMLLSRSIVNAVRSQNPPGRFLQKDSKANAWFDIGDQRAQEKTSQALREGAPDIRKKVTGEVDPAFSSSVKATRKCTENSGEDNNKKTEVIKKEQDDKSSSSAKKDEATTPKASTHQPIPSVSNSPSPQQPQTPGVQPFPVMIQNQFVGYPGMAQAGQYNNGMHFLQQGIPAGQQGQPIWYNPGSNMHPIQLYPTMVMNEQGMMVPAYAHMMPQHQQMQNNMMPPQTQQPSPHVSATGSAVTKPASNSAGAHDDDYEPIPHNPSNSKHDNNNQKVPTFDEYMAAPVDGLEPAGLSFGSVIMNDADMLKLQNIGTSFGSAMSYKPTGQNKNNQHPQSDNTTDGEQLPQAIDALEPTGISFGDVSMMSVGTKKLEETGCSFGTMMSYVRAPDGGLEGIGTSFGSLSLDTSNRDTLFRSLELAAAGPEIPPMCDAESKATGNLLDCSDTESEDSHSNFEIKAQKSEAWDKMQVALQSQKSKGTVNSNELMPPPTGRPQDAETFDLKGSVLSVPTPSMDRNFSNMSAWSAIDDFVDDDDDDVAAPPPPGALEKQGSEDEEKLEMLFVQQMSQKEAEA